MEFVLEWVGTVIGCLILFLFLIGIPFALLRWLWRKGNKK